MKKKSTIILALLLGFLSLFAQDAKKEAEIVKTKMDMFSSKTGTITKFIDTKLPILKTTYAGAETKIRKIIRSR